MNHQQTTTHHSMDDAMAALTDQYRRRLLVSLLGREPNESVHAVDIVASVDGSTTGRMHHVHLPKLADQGYILWDRETGTVMQGPQFGEIEPILQLLSKHVDEFTGEEY